MAQQTITVDFNANLARFTSAIDKATADLNKFQSNAERVGKQIGNVFGALGTGLSIAGLGAMAKQGIDAADALNDMSTRLGVTVKDLASMQLVAEQSGTSLEGLGVGIAKLNKSASEAAGGNEELAKILTGLGVTAASPLERFYQLADAVKGMADPTARAAELSAILGKNYLDLVPTLVQGSDALRESAKNSEAFADAMARLAPEADKFNDQLSQLKTNAAGVSASILSSLVPSLNEYVAVMREVVKNGSALDKVRFFALGNASDEIVERVRKAAAAQEKASEAARKAAAAAREATGGKLLGDPAETEKTALKLQTAMAKAFDTKPLDDYLLKFQDRRQKIVAEYAKLKADLTGPDTSQASDTPYTDLSYELTKGRGALAAGDAVGAGIAAERAKAMLASNKDQLGSSMAGYFSEQIKAYELSIVDAEEKTAVAAADALKRSLDQAAKEVAAMDPVKVPLATDAIAADMRATIETIRRELEANPLRIPVQVTGAGGVDIADAAQKRGGR